MALRATRAFLGEGKSVDETAALIWRGLQASPVGDPSNPWTEEQARAIVEDLAAREATPLENSAWGPMGGGADVRADGTDAASATAGAPEGQGLPLLDEVPPFPLDALPPAFRALVAEAATALPCPPDFVALPLLGAAGAAIGTALELRLKRSWREGPNLFLAAVGRTGSKKTPGQEVALSPVFRAQQRLAREHAWALEVYRSELAAWEGTPKPERGPKSEAPTFRHVMSSDATTEALAPMLAQSKGIVLHKDELSGWVRGMDQYRQGGKGADRQHYLSMWSRTAIKVDRKSSPTPIFVARPCLSVVGGIQPDLLSDLADAAGREDGFLDRLLWGYPDPVPDRWTTAEVSLEAQGTVETIFERLYLLVGETDPTGEPVPRTLRLSPEAATLWEEWYADHVAEMDDEDFLQQLRGPWAKMPGHLARLVLILHTVEGVTEENGDVADEIAADPLGDAADLIDYFKAHARRVYRILARARRDLAFVILAALRDRGPLSGTAIYREVLHSNYSAERIKTILETLEEAGLVTHERQQGETGRPATVWRLA
jgi:hypothetical protein